MKTITATLIVNFEVEDDASVDYIEDVAHDDLANLLSQGGDITIEDDSTPAPRDSMTLYFDAATVREHFDFGNRPHDEDELEGINDATLQQAAEAVVNRGNDLLWTALDAMYRDILDTARAAVDERKS